MAGDGELQTKEKVSRIDQAGFGPDIPQHPSLESLLLKFIDIYSNYHNSVSASGKGRPGNQLKNTYSPSRCIFRIRPRSGCCYAFDTWGALEDPVQPHGTRHKQADKVQPFHRAESAAE